jgi:hypothetical protein
MDFDQAKSAVAMWKTEELMRVSCMLIQAGVRCLEDGIPYFGPDDIPEDFRAGGQGMTGSSVNMLRSAGLIADYYGDDIEAGVRHGRRKSKRASANGRKICLYQVVNMGLAREFLRRHGAVMESRQKELAI